MFFDEDIGKFREEDSIFCITLNADAPEERQDDFDEQEEEELEDYPDYADLFDDIDVP